MNTTRDKGFWNAYLDERRSTYEFRCRRYRAVYEKLVSMGLNDFDSITDIGAGRKDFEKFMREQGWIGSYIPVDGCIDGVDLDAYECESMTDWVVAIEVLEHLYEPFRLLEDVKRFGARRGVVITTPNPEVVDVLAIDRTHVTPISYADLRVEGMTVERATLFASPKHRKENDTLLAWWKR